MSGAVLEKSHTIFGGEFVRGHNLGGSDNTGGVSRERGEGTPKLTANGVTASLALGIGRPVALQNLNMCDAFEEQVRRTPDRQAVACAVTSLTYAQLDRQANELAHALRAGGVGQGDVVGILLPRSVQFLVAVFAALKTGAAYMSLDTQSPKERSVPILRNTRARWVITSSALQAGLPDSVEALVLDELPELSDCAAQPPQVNRTPDDLVYVVNTSGSSGEPKSVAVEHKSFANLIAWYTSALDLTRDDKVLIIGATTFDACQKNFFAPLLLGGAVIFPETELFDPDALVGCIERHKITFVNGTPTNFYPLVEGPEKQQPGRLSSLRWVVLGGEPINVSRLSAWLSDGACHARILNTYGPTEATDICSAYAFGAGATDQTVPIGQPIPNIRLAVVDEGGSPVAAGEEGELWIGGAGVAVGYLGREDLTAAAFVESDVFGAPQRVYRTGDRVYWRADGELVFVGRMDQQVKFRGYRVELGDIEKTMYAVEGVREAAAVLALDRPDDPELVAFASGADGIKLDGAAVRAALGTKLPAYEVPARVIVLNRLPQTPNGKIDRRALLRLTAGSPAPCASRRVFGASLTGKLSRLWADIVGHSDFGADDNLFDRGGNSLTIVRLQSAIAANFGQNLPIVVLFSKPSIAQLAQVLSAAADGPPRTAAAVAPKRHAMLSRKEAMRQARRPH